MNKPNIAQIIYSSNDSKWRVVWDWNGHIYNRLNIDYWEIWRKEGSTWVNVGQIGNSDRNNGWYVFDDELDTSPFSHANMFKIRGVYKPNRNIEPYTDFSDVHQTQHVVANIGPNNTINLFIYGYYINSIIPTGKTVRIYKGTSENKRIQHVIDLPMDIDGITTFTDSLNQYTYYVADIDLYLNPAIVLNESFLNVTPSNIDFVWNPESQSISIESNVNWTITDNVSWLSYNVMSGNGNSTVNISASDFACELSPTSRMATVTISNGDIIKTISVTQLNKFKNDPII